MWWWPTLWMYGWLWLLAPLTAREKAELIDLAAERVRRQRREDAPDR